MYVYIKNDDSDVMKEYVVTEDKADAIMCILNECTDSNSHIESQANTKLVKEVSEIPYIATKGKLTQRDRIRMSVLEAIENKVNLFEFEDSCYNYNTLCSEARLACYHIFLSKFYKPAVQRAEVSSVHGIDRYVDYYYHRCFKFIQKKLDDRVHVYCEINFYRLDNLDNDLKSRFNETKEDKASLFDAVRT